MRQHGNMRSLPGQDACMLIGFELPIGSPPGDQELPVSRFVPQILWKHGLSTCMFAQINGKEVSSQSQYRSAAGVYLYNEYLLVRPILKGYRRAGAPLCYGLQLPNLHIDEHRQRI